MNLNFTVSSGLKNIIGSDLISDDFIAVFELVKNSYDAHASNVEIIFSADKIIIWDNGKGMDFADLKEKWLFVAYSAKKSGVEDNDLLRDEFKDYRRKITPASYYAGAKGIGRFSCDRLGASLLLTTKKPGRSSEAVQLKTDWGKFEKDPKVKFENITVQYIESPKIDSYRKFSHGTILEITSLRSKWPRKKLLDLKRSLEKLINPFDIIDDKNSSAINGKRKFNIKITAESEKKSDEKESTLRNRVNGAVHNFIFETLNLKTTQILTEVSDNGKIITTKLIDRGVAIYEVAEPNIYSPLLSNIRFHLFYLNQSAKLNFKKLMGIPSVEFGSVFLYKNGFRVYPFGEEGEDPFGLDRRKQQGYARYLGTREIIGRIEIYGNDEEFKETSSRDGGLKKNANYLALEECFIEKCLKRLERYVVDIQWALKDQNEDLSLIKGNLSAKGRVAGLVARLVDTEKVRLLSFSKDIVSIIQEKLTDVDDKELNETFDNLENIARKTNDRVLFSELRGARKEYAKLRKQRDEAEKRAREEEEARKKEEEARKKAEEERQRAQEAFERERKKNLFFNATGKDNNRATLGLIHHIKLTSKALNSRIKILTRDLISDKLDTKKTLEILSELKVYSEKILKLSEIVSYSDLNFKYAKHTGDLVRFIEEYINEIKPGLGDVKLDVNTSGLSYSTEFSILEMSIVLDNLISNAVKASEKKPKIQIDVHKRHPRGIKILFSDNGSGVNESEAKYIFDLGFTTTRGSGIGLYMVRDLITQMQGSIKFLSNGKTLNGATFEIDI